MAGVEGFRPQNKEAAFQAGSQGGGDVPRVTKEQRHVVISGPARRRIEALEHVVTSESAAIWDAAKAVYYQFHAAMIDTKVDQRELLFHSPWMQGATPEKRRAFEDFLNRGARQAAAEYLQDDPDNQAAQTIRQQGFFAPFQAHQEFSNAVNFDVGRLFRKYYPEALTDPDQGLLLNRIAGRTIVW